MFVLSMYAICIYIWYYRCMRKPKETTLPLTVIANHLADKRYLCASETVRYIRACGVRQLKLRQLNKHLRSIVASALTELLERVLGIKYILWFASLAMFI